MRFPVPILASRVALAALLALATPAPSFAEDAGSPPRASAALTCAHAAEPGRVRCEVEARPPPGAILKWADAVLVATPPFATPLRARVGPAEATTHEDTVWRWAIALAARTRGSGEVEARVRLVSCVGETCVPTEIAVRSPLVVGD